MTARSRSPRRAVLSAMIAGALAVGVAVAPRAHADEAKPPCHGPGAAGGSASTAASKDGVAPQGGAAPAADRASLATRVELADVALVDQHGRSVPFPSVADAEHVTVMTFVFTTCTTVCPVLSTVMKRLQDKLGDRVGRDVRLVAVTVDPERDTPARLLAYAARHKARPEWLWLTGAKDDVERALKGMGAYTPNFADHQPMVLVGSGGAGTWSRFNGFPSEDALLARIDELRPAAHATAATAATAARDDKARAYFTNSPLASADGTPLRFYDDVLAGKVVLINFMFARCTGACPLIAQKLHAVRRELGDGALGRDVHFVSITVDPEHDTPAQLAEFARKQKAELPGWTFLTGSIADVRAVLAKLGERISEPTDHATGFIAANVRTAHWKRIRPDVPPAGVAEMVRALVAEDAREDAVAAAPSRAQP